MNLGQKIDLTKILQSRRFHFFFKDSKKCLLSSNLNRGHIALKLLKKCKNPAISKVWKIIKQLLPKYWKKILFLTTNSIFPQDNISNTVIHLVRTEAKHP